MLARVTANVGVELVTFAVDRPICSLGKKGWEQSWQFKIVVAKQHTVRKVA